MSKMQGNRGLAAIMFTDIVGYTSIMHKDESFALSLIKKNREIHRKQINIYNGTFIKELGDGVLSSFKTVTDAIYCAIAIQNSIRNDSKLNLRIGVHMAEVTFERGDVFGDGVNLAARLQAAAPVNGIWVSEPIYSNILNHPRIKASFVGLKDFKNVDERVQVYEIDIDSSSIPESVSSQKQKLPHNNTQQPRKTQNSLLIASMPRAFRSAPIPPRIGNDLREKLKKNIKEKKNLAKWFEEMLLPTFPNYTNLMWGSGTFVYYIWWNTMRQYLLKSSKKFNHQTISEFVHHCEDSERRALRDFITIEPADTLTLDQTIGTYLKSNPDDYIPEVEFSIISLARLDVTNKFLLATCYDDQKDTIEEIIKKTTKTIVIMATAKKLTDKLGTKVPFDLSAALAMPNNVKHKKLILAIDCTTKTKEMEGEFTAKIAKIKNLIGRADTEPKGPIMVWTKPI